MAKETPVIQNTKMLLLSLGLALLVVVLYNVQINRIRTESKGTTVKLLQYKRDISSGVKISDRDDLEAVDVDSKLAKGLKGVITDEDRDSVIGHKLAHTVAMGDWVMLSDWDGGTSIGSVVPPNDGFIVLPIDPNYSPGRLLHLSNRVNVLGEVQMSPGQYRTVRLIDGLVVLSIGGKSKDDFARPGEDASNTYHEIGSSLPREMVPQWYNVLSYVKGGRVILELRNANDRVVDPPVFNPEVKEKLNKADPSHGSYSPSGGGGGTMAPAL